MNASVRTHHAVRQLIARARDIAVAENMQGRPDLAGVILNLVQEIEGLREAARGAAIILDQCNTDRTLAQLRATTLLSVAQKAQAFLDADIEASKSGCDPGAWSPARRLSDELKTAIAMARG